MYFLFDLDGTLVKTTSLYVELFQQMFPEKNITKRWFEKEVHGHSDDTVFKNLFGKQLSKERLNELSKLKDQLFIKLIDKRPIQAVPGSVEFITYLYNYNFPCSIVTNCNRVACEKILKSLKIDKIIDNIIIGGECIRSKPYPDPYQKAINFYNTNGNNCVVFEDTPAGLLSAKTAGVSCIVGIETMYSQNYLLEHSPDITIPDFDLNFGKFLKQIHTVQLYNNNLLLNLSNRVLNTIQKNDIPAEFAVANSIKLKGGYIADVYRFTLYYKNISPDYPKTVILKYDNKSDHECNKIARELQLYEREQYFYNNISSKLINLKTPQFYGLLQSRDEQTIEGIVLQDIGNDQFILNPTISTELCKFITIRLAEMHAQFWNNTDQFTKLKKHNHPDFNPSFKQFCQDRIDKFIKKWKNKLSEKQLQLFKKAVNKFDWIQEKLSEQPLTLCHGDVKAANMFVRKLDNEPFFIDWQYIANGKGVQDLIFFLLESFSTETQCEIEKDVYQLYYDTLIKKGVEQYSFSQMMNDVKLGTLYFPVYVSMWFGTLEEEELIDVTFPERFVPKVAKALERYNVDSIL